MKSGMRTGGRFYYAGFIAAMISVIAAELIWVPAPLQTGGGMEWIEVIDWLIYGLAVIPLCWGAGAAWRLFTDHHSHMALRTIRGGALLASLALTLQILFSHHKLTPMIIALAVASLLALADLLATGAAERRGAPWRTIGAVAALGLLFAALLVPTGYRVTYPGMTLNLNRYAHVAGGASGGKIDGVLVFDRPAVLADRLYGALFPQYDFLPIPEDEPPLSETYTQVLAMKNDANEVAAAIAMNKAGIGEGVVPTGVRIVAIVKGAPAEGLLQAGDRIDAVNGNKVEIMEELIAYMGEVTPGEAVKLGIKRNGEDLTISVPTIASPQDVNKAVFGVSVQNDIKLDTPRNIHFNSYIAHVGGPSHGAMLTLAIIDQLVEGGVTGDVRVAGTGTIEPDGSIGMVGGIPQKAYAVSRTDADVFFVPKEGESAAREAAPELNIVAVSHIDEVLRWLERHKSQA